MTAGLHVRRVPGAILWGMLATTLAGIAMRLIHYTGVVDSPPSLRPVLFVLDFQALLKPAMAPVVAILLSWCCSTRSAR